jgi:autotransporter-associated beta strand protein
VNQGTLRVLRGANLGPNTNTITMNGGSLEIHSDESNATANDAIAGLGHNIVVNGNALLGADNGLTGAAANVGDDLNMGSLTVNGGYVLQIGGFDGIDWNFTSATFAGTPILDLGLGRTSAVPADLSTTTINGVVSGSGFQVIAGNLTAASVGTLQLTGTAANDYVGTVTVGDVPVQLNKTAGQNAITGDLVVIGGGNGAVTWMASNQMADGGTLKLTRGTVNFNGQAETIAGIEMSGGTISTGNNAVIAITGDVNVTGTSSANGFIINDNANVTVGGVMRIGEFGRVVMAAGGTPGSSLSLNGLELTGSSLVQSPNAGANIVRLLGDVTTFAAPIPAQLGASTDTDTFLELNGVRTFNVANGPAGVDLIISTLIRDNTAPATAGGLTFNGGGLVQLGGAGTVNTYTGGTTLNAGTLELFKNAGVNAIPGNAAPGADLTIGDGIGGVRADRVMIRNINQIADAADVQIASSGVLDLQTFSSTETIGSLAGSGNVDLGPTSVLTVGGVTNGNSTVYGGAIVGAGSLVKAGSGILELTGASEIVGGAVINNTGGLVVSGSLSGAVTVNTGATLGGDGSIIGAVTVNTGATLAPGASPGSLDVGNLALSGTFAVELGGTSSYDQVNVTGSITLGGTLNGSLVGGYTPSGQSELFFIAINDGFDAVNNTFAGLAQDGTVSIDGFDFVIGYTGDSVAGTFTGGNDVVLLVPEPGSMALLLGGLCLLAGGRRIRRRS